MDDLIDFAELKAAGMLPTISVEAQELIHLCLSGDNSPSLMACIEALPALEHAVLYLSGYRGRDALPDAVAAIGLTGVRQLALALDLCVSYRRGACADFDYQQHWSHAFATACAAQALAAEMPVASGLALFCQGLMSSVGRLGLATARPRSYARLLRACADGGADMLLRSEGQQYGYSHLAMGAALLRHWHMGREYSNAVLCQETPHMASDRETRHLARLLQLAACMANLYLAQPGERKFLVEEMANTSTRLQLDTRVLLDIVDEANDNWRQWCALMDLQGHLPPALRLVHPTPVILRTTTAAEA